MAVYTPTLGEYKTLQPFRYWCQKVLPLVYDDSLSYYELLNKVVDYLNKTMEDVETLHEDVEALHAAYEQLQQYVNDYFDSLDVQEEINTKLDAMASDGSLSTLLAPYIPDVVTDWLNEHITPTTPAIDSSLTVSGAGADAKVVGDKFKVIDADLIENGIENIFIDGTYNGGTYNGITVTWTGDRTATISGTATANYNNNLFANANAFPANISAGDLLTVAPIVTDTDIKLQIFSYVNGSWGSDYYSTMPYQYKVPSTATGMLIRIYVPSGSVVDGTIHFDIFKTPSTEIRNQAFPIIFNSVYPQVDVIEYLLNTYGGVMFGKGTYYLPRTLNMPDNTTIMGIGSDCVTLLAASGQTAINCGANCTIKDIRIHSEHGYSSLGGTDNGIEITGTYDTPPLKYNIKIHNVIIDGFGLGGIHAHRTGTWVGCSLTVSDCQIYHCHAGLLLQDYSEFGRYTNVMCRDNYAGVVNKSGNNVFVNCSFSNNDTGVMILGDDGDNSRNNGHGALIGCTINHSKSNTGYAVICRGVTNGFMFNGCHIWYGKTYALDSTGIVYNDCTFGSYNTAHISENHNTKNLFYNSCLFKNNITNYYDQGGVTQFNNCYTFDGTAVGQ